MKKKWRTIDDLINAFKKEPAYENILFFTLIFEKNASGSEWIPKPYMSSFVVGQPLFIPDHINGICDIIVKDSKDNIIYTYEYIIVNPCNKIELSPYEGTISTTMTLNGDNIISVDGSSSGTTTAYIYDERGVFGVDESYPTITSTAGEIRDCDLTA